ncbi:hypothetical protein SLEP1_g13055 [Rubroshorea leprosula]|uniref:Galactokinase N-terminal domain-containing protein n=1 Tax=Rubroshorea leprosula TaxID=152421 RepID=A0AAV5INI5_9ROSI|nr:hypothetical protein SLEP1_g13055 [Rubroshorea leprosula]
MVPWMSEYFTILLQLAGIKKIVSEASGRDVQDIRVVISPYRICPLGAHIDHQGGTVSAMTINKGILLGFVPSGDTQVVLHSGQFKGEVRFRSEKRDTGSICHIAFKLRLSDLHELQEWSLCGLVITFSCNNLSPDSVGLKQALTNNPGYNRQVAECQEAARFLLHNLGSDELEPLLCNGKYFVQV